MDKFLRSMALVAVTAAFAAPVSAAPTAPVGAATPATATAQIVGMTGSHTVSIDEAGVVACTAELLCGGTTTAANFDVAGSADQIVKVYVAPTTLTNAGGATLAFSPTAASASPLKLDNAGLASFAVGGSITVAPSTASGIYLGDMDVTIDYN